MSVGCFMISPKEFLIFGGINGLGDKSKACSTFVFENEERGLHSWGKPGAGLIMDQADTFANPSNCFHPTEDTVVLCGGEHLWQISLKKDQQSLTKLIKIN
jgi:hypothetical protein